LDIGDSMIDKEEREKIYEALEELKKVVESTETYQFEMHDIFKNGTLIYIMIRTKKEVVDEW